MLTIALCSPAPRLGGVLSLFALIVPGAPGGDALVGCTWVDIIFFVIRNSRIPNVSFVELGKLLGFSYKISLEPHTPHTPHV